MASNHSCEIYNYFTTSTLTPQTVCVSSVRVADAIQRINSQNDHIDIASGEHTRNLIILLCDC